MKFSYIWLKELAKFRESPEALAEFLTLRAFEVDSITRLQQGKQGEDWVLDIKVLPNRVADASGHLGIAREIAALKNLKLPAIESRLAENTKRRTSDVLRVKIERAEDCARYTARIIDGVTLTSSPLWVRERLEACGIQSINNVVDAANYVMLELGQPLHVFDITKLRSKNEKQKTIIVRRAKKKEKIVALDDKTYTLNPDILVIADEQSPLAIAGIKGGEQSGVSSQTSTILLEAANFDPPRIRIGSHMLHLKTDASYRFEHGLDPNETLRAIDRLAELIVGTAGGEVLMGRVDSYSRPAPSIRILFHTDYANRMIGATIPQKFFEESFQRLGWKFMKKSTTSYIVEPPTARKDITIEEDIIEEIARLFGYEHIPALAPQTHLAAAPRSDELEWERLARTVLTGSGMSETLLYQFISRADLEIFGERTSDYLGLENPTSPETQYLLRYPVHGYLMTARENIREHDTVSIFGIAKGFRALAKPSQKTPADERKYLVLVHAGKSSQHSETFFELKGILDNLFHSLGISDAWYDDALTPPEQKNAHGLHPYRIAKINIGKETLGMIAELHPETLAKLKAKTRIVSAQLSFDRLWQAARSEAEYQPPSRFPAVVRDIAVVVPERIKTETITNIIETVGGTLLIDSDLFDYFQDDALTTSRKKSLAFHLIFQSPERTLTDKEVAERYTLITKALAAKGWGIRS